MSRQLTVTAIGSITALILVFTLKNRFMPSHEARLNQVAQQSELPVQTISSKENTAITEKRQTSIADQTFRTMRSSATPPIELTEGNFESNVHSCFQGEPCRLTEKPSKLYKDFKLAGDRKAMDHLISFLRSKLKDPDFRALHKDELKEMIDDFYPPTERQFQDAAYYSYLGDLQKSLDLYLDLEQQAQTNPNLKSPPKLNIANVLFDMKKFAEALPYYQSALADYNSGAQKVAFPDPREMIAFIERRMSESKERLRK